VRGFVQKMMVGGGCSGSSSPGADFFLEAFDLALDFLEFLAGSGGARRKGIVDSGGLQSR
jgi:hypothetical protein